MSPEKKFTVSQLEEGLIIVEIAPDVDIDVPEVEAVKRETLELTKGGKYVTLVDSGPNSTITREAMSLTASEEYSQDRVAMAFIVKTLPHRIITNFYIKFKRSATMSKAFDKKQNAIEWLKEQLVQEGVY